MQPDLQLPSPDSVFALIGPDAGYTGIHIQTGIYVPKLCVKKMCLCCVSSYCYISPFPFLSLVDNSLFHSSSYVHVACIDVR